MWSAGIEVMGKIFQQVKGNNYGISRLQVRLWDRDFEKLLVLSKGKDSVRKNIGSGAEARSVELDQAVFDWFKDERVEGRGFSNYFLQSRARVKSK